MDVASGKGFRLIADYIFGNNALGATGAENASQKIAMTAPVTAELMAVDPSMATARQWRIYFAMPGQYSMQTPPKPNNAPVRLRELPARTLPSCATRA